MLTPDTKQQAEAALQRINRQINRSAGQHIRAVRRVRAGATPPPDVRLPDLAAPGAPAAPTSGLTAQSPQADDTEHVSGMRMLAYGLVALALTGCASIIAFAFAVAGRSA